MPAAPVPGPRGAGLPGTGLTDIGLSSTVVVALGDRTATKVGDHELLIHLVARLAGVDAASVALAQRCPHCGAPGHGPLRVSIDGSSSGAPLVSLARAGGLLALAVTAAGPVGIDLESLAALAHAPLNDVVLSPAETATLAMLSPTIAASALAAIWTTKEAVLTAAGVGLQVDPRELTIALDPAGSPEDPPTIPRLPVSWPGAPFPGNRVQVLSVDAPRGLVCTVAVVCAARPALMMVPLIPRW